VSELAADGIPVTVACRVLKLVRQPYYRWLAEPVTEAEWVEAHRANALFDAHRDDPEFGYRFLVDEARDNGQAMVDRTAWRICSSNGWWSVSGKTRPYGKTRKAGVPAHDDHVGRDFTAPAPNVLWLADITEHRTDEGKLYLCAIKDCFSNRIVGYSISDRMKSRLALAAVNNAAARRGDIAGCLLHTDRGSQFRARSFQRTLTRHGRLDGPGRFSGRQRRHGELLLAPAEERPGPPPLGHPRPAADRDRHMDRKDLSPPAPPGSTRPIDPNRIRYHHDRTGRSGRVTTYHLILQQTREPIVDLRDEA
jgi:putative transposase